MQSDRNRRFDNGRLSLRSILGAALLALPACGPVLATGPNAIGVHIAGASYPSSPAASSAESEVSLGLAEGVRFSYSRRLKGERRLWLGPEGTMGFAPESRIVATDLHRPQGVSRVFVTGLLRLNMFPPEEWAADVPWIHRFGFSFGGGVAYGRFAESRRLLDGAPNVDRVTDGAFGPAFGFGIDYQVTRHFVCRIDGTALFLKPDLSFPWPGGFDHRFVGGGGLLVVF